MRRLLLIAGGALVLALIFVFVFIPAKIVIDDTTVVASSPDAVFRKMIQNTDWKKWWPKEGKVQNDSTYLFNDYTYHIKEKTTGWINVQVEDDKMQSLTSLHFFPKNADSVLLSWHAELAPGNDPLKKLSLFLKSKKLKAELQKLLSYAQAHYSKTESVYDFEIKEVSVTDSVLVSTAAEMKTYPTVEQVYLLIDKLKAFIQTRSIEASGYPMLNIITQDSSSFLVKVALPVSKRGENTTDIEYKRMMEGGNILITEVKGGPANINRAFKALESYITDHHRASPAIPFQSLIIDRKAERDTSKWITRIFYPVM